MNTLIIYHSEHHGNTEKVAQTIASALNAELVRSQDIEFDDVRAYDLVGIGSGVYYGHFHQNLFRFIDRLPAQIGKKAFVFSTTGSKSYGERANNSAKLKLKEKGFDVVGEFTCLGFDTALSTEGINRGRPSAEDLNAAKTFALSLMKK
jgi:flavodoxin